MVYSQKDETDSTVRWWVHSTQGFITSSSLTDLKGPMYLMLVKEHNVTPTSRVFDR